MKTKRIKIGYITHFLIDGVFTMIIYHFLGFEIAVLLCLVNLGVDVVKGFEGYFKSEAEARLKEVMEGGK